MWLAGGVSHHFAMLEQAITEKKGIILLTGDAGTGKSTLVKMITDILGNRFTIPTLSNPELRGLDLFNFLAVKLGFDKEFNSKSAFLVHLRNFLRTLHSNAKDILLVVDQADRTEARLFEELALLSDIELNDRKMISILVVGRKEWIEESIRQVEKQTLDKITAQIHIEPLNAEDTADYIRYCLSSVGARKTIFEENAIQQIFSYSRGNLNLINVLCERALRMGYSNRKKKINAAIVKACGAEIQEGTAIDEETDPDAATAANEITMITSVDAAAPAKRWFWIKALFFILFLFSSYLLYEYQTKDSLQWKTEEIAQKEYSTHKIKENKIVAPDNPQESDENSIGPGSLSQEAAANSPADHHADFEQPVTAKESDNSDAKSKTSREWPFPTFKKILYFKYDSNTLPAGSLEILDKIADYAVHNLDREFIIKGYTDSTGAESYNLTISKYRADAVKNYLIAQGVNPAGLETFGLGSQDPIFSNATAGGRKLNRRVEIELKLK